MARNAGEDLDRFGGQVAVQRLVEARGIGLVREGDELVGLCVLCDDGEGLRIDCKANTWSCRGCGEGGGPVQWVMASRGVSQRHAIELLREGVTDGEVSGRPPKRATTTQLEALDDALSDDELLSVIVGFYHRTLLESAEPAAFLSSRALAHRDAIDHFRLGYSNRTLGLRVPAANRKAGRALRRQLQRLGVWSPKGHEAFAGSLVVPVFDAAGQVTQLYGRKLRSDLRKGTRLHTWLASDARPLFNAPVLLATDEVILAGSIIDALSFWCAGFRHVVAVDSVEGFDATHLQALVEHGVGRVLIGFRRDEDAETAAKRTAVDLMGAGVECFRLTFPHGMDANDFVRSSANPTDAIGDVLRGAVWMGKGTKKARRRQPPPEAAGASTTAAPSAPTPDDDLEEQPVDDDGQEQEPVLGPMLPAAPVGDVHPELARDGDEMRITFGDRSWRLRGLAKNTSFDVLRVNVLVSVPAVERGQGFHVDTLDLYSARARASFAKEAAEEIGVEEKIVRRDLGRVFMAAEGLVDEAIRRAQEPTDTRVVLDDDERAAALELLRDPNLVGRVVADFARVGMVGESTNCLVGYLAAVSRLLDRPLAVIVQSTSAAGKSALMDAVLDFVPDEDLVRYSAMTGQSLYYLGEHDLAHKVLAIAEEEGAERASYPLKLLQSEGEVSIASTGKDNATGRLVAHPYRVKGPAAIFLTTTAIDVDEELRNRCIVLSVDEDRAQTRGIHDRQRRARTLDGILAGNDRHKVLKVHRDAQRLLEPVAVVNPFADRLTFVDAITRTRRDHVKYLTLIDTIALLHQHQRERHTATTAAGQTVTYIEATVSDIALANRLAHDALGHSLDELPPQTRRLLTALDEMVTGIAESQDIDRDRVRFTRRQARERLGLGDTQLKVHLARLVELELVWAHRAERSGGFVYELAWSADHDGDRFLPGLVDADTLETTTATRDRSGPRASRSGGGRRPVAGRSGVGRDPDPDAKPQVNGHKPAPEEPDSSDRTSGGGAHSDGSHTPADVGGRGVS